MDREPDVGAPGYQEYHSVRADQERARSATAHDPVVRRLHLELAERHAAIARRRDRPSIIAAG